MATNKQLRVLTLNRGENREASLFRLEKGWTLHFGLGPNLADQNVRVFTNHPASSKATPDRHQYREVMWQNLTGRQSDIYDNFAEVHMVLSGSFNYFFTLDGSGERENANGMGYFLVDPVLHSGLYDEKVPLDSICCQTVIAKSLGPFDEWRGRLRVAKESGYNMVHFTPLQELGASNSSYCIRDQLLLNSVFSRRAGPKVTFDDVDALMQEMKKDWEVLSLTDLVFNHTANESPWIQEHPECGYNMVNSPHLKPAYLMDRILWHFSMEVADGRWADRGIPAEIRTEDHLNAIRAALMDVVLPKHRLHEYFMVHIENTLQQFRTSILYGNHGDTHLGSELVIVPDPHFRRLKSVIVITHAIHLFYSTQPKWMAEDDRINASVESLRAKLEELNGRVYADVQGHLGAAVSNVVANARWRFVDAGGQRVTKVCHEPKKEEPIMWNYFTLPKETRSVEQDEEAMHGGQGAYCMAHNGWVMNDDPLRNFAEPGSNIYLRRELIPWGDSVKLRYGKTPDDCPFLWKHMRDYTVLAAKIFHGVRLDNCHSTPIHVAEYMLDEARKVRPDLYVIAELFTSSEYKDNIFINRLGLTSLIREALNAWDSRELGRLVHRHGGFPVGAFIQPPVRPLMPCTAHAMFMDQTHDNPSPVEKRQAEDLLPSAALVAMTCCATGSNRGYDEVVPHHINVVTEPRFYQSWTVDAKPKVGQVNGKVGLISAKRALNQLHQLLGNAGFNQVYVDKGDKDIVSVTRHNPVSHQSVILVARTVFGNPGSWDTGYIPPLVVPGVVEEILLEAEVTHLGSEARKYAKDTDYINGLPDYEVRLREHVKVAESAMIALRPQSDSTVREFEFVNFKPGSVIAIKVSLNTPTKSAILNIRQCLSQFGYRMRTYSGRNLKELSSTTLDQMCVQLSLDDLNRILYRCDAEERDDGKGVGAYDVPGHGKLVYCGLQGVMTVLSKIRAVNDLGHPLCENLRNGDWMMQYIANRLKGFPGTSQLGHWFEEVFTHMSQVPRYLIPCYFDAVVTGVYLIVEEVAWAKLGDFVRTGSTFVRALGMGSIQFCSRVPTAPLPPLSPALDPPQPPTIVGEDGRKEQACVTLAAGLPHFASGIFRNWGRDTFISLRGLLLLSGRRDEARFTLLGYGACLRHGLIPNLLGAGTHARYNCRDAVWWWLQCVQDYCRTVPDGLDILNDQVSRIFPKDDSFAQAPGMVDQPLHDIIQEAVQKHADGLEYRERHAGHGIDNDMSDHGFDVKMGVDWSSGFVFGGNGCNCGTWMDKMGSSERAGNKGRPATPRDGSAVELVGLCASATRWLSELAASGDYPYDGVKIKDGAEKVTFADWHKRIQNNFEKFFWISTFPDHGSDSRPDLINKTGIYKDTLGASQPWTDYQLRPNVPIAMVLAPELFTPEHAWTALETIRECLLGPLGMKTLDPSDWAYNGHYINSDDSSDPSKAKGFNYHQGPEWVWPLGYFLRAKIHFASLLESQRPGLLQETVKFVRSTLSKHNVHIQASEWKSLPELTNQNGAVCHDSCSAQAWSVACLLEVLHDMERYLVAANKA